MSKISIQESLNRASQQLIRGELLSAKDIYLSILDQDPKNVDALHGLSAIAFQLNDSDRVRGYLHEAAAIDPNHAECHRSLGMYYLSQREWNKAAQAFERAKVLKEKEGGATPQYLRVLVHLASIYLKQERHKEASRLLRKVLRYEPGHPQALLDLFISQAALRHFKEAEKLLIKFAVNQADLCSGLGYLSFQQNRFFDAIRHYKKAIRLDPSNPDRYFNLGYCHHGKKEYRKCIGICEKGLKLDPLHQQLLRLLFSAKINGCSWRNRTEIMERLLAKTGSETDERLLDHVAPSLPIFVGLNNAELKRIADIHAARLLNETEAIRQYQQLTWTKKAKKKLRIGYASSDFHDHPTSHLILPLFGLHDRSRFEIFAYSWGKNDRSRYRKILQCDCDCFVDIRRLTDSQAAQKIYDDNIDILVDLKGYTTGSRPKIFALRSAPIQVGYLGYPGTLGGSLLDYLIADHALIPLNQRKFFSEKIAYLPYCYQMIDDAQPIASAVPKREKYGLPEGAFVFCSFNQNYKIDRTVAEVWMRILQSVPNSVLWFWMTCPDMHKRLSELGRTFGVSSKRIIPCFFEPKPKHLARMQAADLFLDTFVCSAHTGCSDSLWAGLPLLTCQGETFATRVAAGLLKTIGASELIAKDQSSYHAKAIELATHPDKLGRIREKIVKNRERSPLFQSEQQVRFLESAYLHMRQLYLSGKKTQTFTVRSLTHCQDSYP
ncbi:MAG: tetratricopeptide repeat protein [Waddliaceae bacterium]